MANSKPAVAFFYENAGFSYTPGKESREEGRLRCAARLAEAEAWAAARNYSFAWSIDELDSSEFSDVSPPWVLWVCEMLNGAGVCLEALCGIDFGRGDPVDPYKRVVEAELALEQMTRPDRTAQARAAKGRVPA